MNPRKGLGKMGHITREAGKTSEYLVDRITQQSKLKICNICFNSACLNRPRHR